MIKRKSDESGSTKKENGAVKFPAEIQSKSFTDSNSPVCFDTSTKIKTETMKEASTLPQPIIFTNVLESLFPNRLIFNQPIKGSKGTNQINFIIKKSPLKFIQKINIGRFCISENHHQYRKTNCNLSCCNGHYKKHKHLTRWVRKITRKSNKQKIDSIQHQFNAHENNYRVSAEQHPQNANAEKHSA